MQHYSTPLCSSISGTGRSDTRETLEIYTEIYPCVSPRDYQGCLGLEKFVTVKADPLGSLEHCFPNPPS